MTPGHPTRRRLRKRPRWHFAAATAGAVTVAAALFAMIPAPGAPVSTTIPALAAADADTLVLAPYSAAWWEKVSAMAPADTNLAGLDLEGSGVPITSIGYSRSPDRQSHDLPMTGPSRLLYLETATAEDAARLADWLKHADGFEGRRIFTEGATVIVAQSWVAEFTVPEQTMAEAGYAGILDAGRASMYRNPDNEVQSLAGQSDAAARKALTTVMRNGFGFTEGTSWVGTSGDGTSWAGEFRSGGVRPEQINFTETQAAVDATSTKLAEYSDATIKYAAFSDGIGAALRSATFRAPGQDTMGLPGTNTPDPVQNEKVSVVSDVTGWNAAATGVYSVPENISTQAVSANEESMTVTLTYAQRQ